VVLEPAVQVVALAEPADEDDARDDAALGAERVDLALDEVADLLDDGVEDVLDLLGRHDEEARVEAGFFVVGEAGEAGESVGAWQVVIDGTHGTLTSWCSSSLKLRLTNSSKYRSPICHVLPFFVFISSNRL
jgi:hypothetical protein